VRQNDKAISSYIKSNGILTILTAITVISVIASLCIGTYPLPFSKAFEIMMHFIWPWSSDYNTEWTAKEIIIIELIRMPRVLLAVFVGVALGISGTALQGMMRNPLVGPDLVGVASGAAFGGVLAVMMDMSSYTMVIMAFGGGMMGMVMTFALASLSKSESNGMTLILSGIFVGAFLMACVGLGQFFANDGQLNEITFWLLGTLTRANEERVWTIAIPTLVGGSALMFIRWRLNILSLNDTDAMSLGINVRLIRWVIISIVAWIVASQVAVSGIVAWIGLVIPHFARMLVGPDHRSLLPASALLGALFVLAIDALTRTVIQEEIPIGVLTTLIGTPIIILIFWKKQTKGWISD